MTNEHYHEFTHVSQFYDCDVIVNGWLTVTEDNEVKNFIIDSAEYAERAEADDPEVDPEIIKGEITLDTLNDVWAETWMF